MVRGPVNQKQIAIETTYGFLNIHLALLDKAIKEKDVPNIIREKAEVRELRSKLLKLGYFERGK